MPQAWWQQLLQNGKVLVILLVVIFSILRAVAKALQERAKARQAKLDRQRRELEAIRTGRPADPSAPSQIGTPQPQPIIAASPSSPGQTGSMSAREQLEALAAKRRAAIDELQRRRQAHSTGTPASTSPPTPTTPEQVLATILGLPVPTQGLPQSRTPRPAGRPRPTSAPPKPAPPRARKPIRDPRSASPQTYPAPIPVPRAAPKPAPAPPPSMRAEIRRTLPPEAEPASSGPTPESPSSPATRADPFGLRALSRGDLQRAIVLREIMEAPLALRN